MNVSLVRMSETSRTITWSDPRAGGAGWETMSGLEFMTALKDGLIGAAPIAAHFDMRLVSVAVGDAVFEAKPGEWHYNPIGSVHGGFFATLLDSACGCAVHTTLPVGQAYTSLEISVRFLRPITAETGLVTAHGWVTKPGSRAAFVEADLRDAAGKVLATASSVCAVFPVR